VSEGDDGQTGALHVARGRGLHAPATSDALLARANEHNAAVLVVGARKHSLVREALLGSVALGLLHHAHRPVLVVPVS
jgi:nucleotide-binding universal stress UspA family protein